MPRSYALGARFESFVDAQVKSGRYNNASEVVRAGLRLLEDSEQLRELKLAELRRLVEEGRKSGEGNPAEDVFARLEAKYRALPERA
jgi:antitoxin ParD1/3/4